MDRTGMFTDLDFAISKKRKVPFRASVDFFALKRSLEELIKEIENGPYLEVTNQWFADRLKQIIKENT